MKQITPIEANLETTEAVYDIAFGTQELDELDEYVARDVVQHVSHEPDIRGLDNLRAYFEELYAAMPDISYELIESVADEERVVYHVELTGTFEGDMPWGDDVIEATGDVVSWEAFSSFRFEDDEIVEANVVVDQITFLRTIGLLPELTA